MEASHFNRHPQGDKPSETKKHTQNIIDLQFVTTFVSFLQKCLNVLLLQAAQKQKTRETDNLGKFLQNG